MFTKIAGTLSSKFSIGKTNTMNLTAANASGTCLQVATGRGSTLGRLQVGAPTQGADATTKSYVDSLYNNRISIYDTYAAGVALVAGRCVAMGSSGLVYLTAATLPSFVGITTAAAAANANCRIALGPVVGGLSGITKGAVYYLGSNGSISTTASNCVIGVGVSATEIRLNPMRVDGAYIGS